MSLRLLLIDDDARLAELLTDYLRPHDVALEHARDGTIGLTAAAAGGFDAILLDVMMPGPSGLEVLRRLRATPATAAVPVLMLTARGDEADRVVGLELGADDYVAKPFSPRELLARVRAVLRRVAPAATGAFVSAAGISADVGARAVTVDGVPVELTGLEFDLLLALLRRAGRVVSREALLELAGRADTTVGERAVDVHVSRLRRKLGEGGARLRTVRGAGYVLARPRDDGASDDDGGAP
jgi:two-component system OmpR family response regulator